MTRRPAVTLMEVLVAMFIMAIGMLALLALFPVGAVSMAQALKDDRCAYAAAMAESIANAMNVRHDPNVITAFANTNPLWGTSNTLVYVDPYGALSQLAPAPFGMPLGQGFSPVTIPRVYPSFATTILPATDRWFSLPDDIGFTKSGTADTSTTGGTIIDRGRRYSYAYLLRLLPSSSENLVQLYVVVYNGRPIQSLGFAMGEWPYPVAAVFPPNGLQINVTNSTAKRGGWVLDTNGNFYRITNITESVGATILETQQNLPPTMAVGQYIIVMDNVAEVFDKGTGWRP
jgi:hypothetical protein